MIGSEVTVVERESIEIRSRAELRAWLSAHHDQTEPIWLVHYKKAVPEFYVPWGEIVQEALCFGWIDGQAKSLGPDKMKHLLCPRRRGSFWSAVNKRHIVRLEAEGLMTEAGRAAIDRAKADASWVWLDDIENLVVPPDLHAALDADPAARSTWEAYPKSEKKAVLYQLKAAKRPATRQRRLSTVLDNASQGRRTYS